MTCAYDPDNHKGLEGSLMTAPSILQRLYDSGIGALVVSTPAAGVRAVLCDDRCPVGSVLSYAEAEAWLTAKACELYPESAFAREEAARVVPTPPTSETEAAP